ncbi:MAG: NrtA/SsuA/CpmA family ABC transporter substrate-binding protein [Candidatus Accumulibacter sp.]|jgi:NitT/TauT family transport system substrate-binding protein|nr:NrtA/SsuA/CpmA family ABC transporter substrate-binding protein [Accumulibacter sp.]
MNESTRRDFLRATGAAAVAWLAPSGLAAAGNIKASIAIGSTDYSWALSLVAKQGGYWEQFGTDIIERDFPSGRDAMQALMANSANFSTTTDTPLVFSLLRGVAPRVLLDFSRYTSDMQLVSIAGHGVNADDPGSLKGKKVGTPIGTSGQYMLARYLKYAGLKESDITLINISPADLINTLIRGDIDAFAWTLTAGKAAITKSEGKAFLMAQRGFEAYFRSHLLLLTNDQTIAGNQPLLINAVKAHLAAEKRIKDDPKWADLIAARVRIPATDILEATNNIDLTICFDESFIDDLVTEAQWAIEAKLAPAPGGDLRKLLCGAIYDAPLKNVAFDRVSLK